MDEQTSKWTHKDQSYWVKKKKIKRERKGRNLVGTDSALISMFTKCFIIINQPLKNHIPSYASGTMLLVLR